MEYADEVAGRSPSVEVIGPSLILDLTWCIHAASSVPFRTSHPVLARLYEERRELFDRVSDFWPDITSCFAEAQVIAHHAGVLSATEFSVFRTRAEATLGSIPLDLELSSETSQDRQAILFRLERLQRSATTRREYFDLLEELWSAIEPWWRSEGAPAAEQTAADVRKTLVRGTRWQDIVSAECPMFVDHLPEIIERTEKGQPIVLASCALFGKGLYLELPGCVLVGFGTHGAVQVARLRTEAVVPALRVLADPTRLAIFDYLKAGSVAVSDIAQAFNLAQPTVSVHIKRLREAGLVTAERHGNRLEISVNESTAEGLANDLTTLLLSR